jgi:hypothetical protein
LSDANVGAFWSYAREDDTFDGGRITTLAENLLAEYSLLTASTLELFLDRDSIEWGDAWQERIDQALVGTTFFIPIITPRYFTRDACRHELLKFVAEAQRLGLEKLLLPVYYIDVPELSLETPADEAMSIIKTFQWEDLRGIRLEDQGSAAYRSAVNRLAAAIAKRVLDITQLAVEVPRKTAGQTEESEEDDAPGVLDQLAQTEALIPRLSASRQEYGETMEAMTPIVQEAVRDMAKSDAQGKGFAGRLRVTERLAVSLQEPSERLKELGSSYAADLVNANPGVLTLIEQLTRERRRRGRSLRRYRGSARAAASSCRPRRSYSRPCAWRAR